MMPLDPRRASGERLIRASFTYYEAFARICPMAGDGPGS
jgi:hypothetical protein